MGPGLYQLDGSVVECDRCDTGRTPDALLPSTVTDVDEQFVHGDVGSTQRADRIDDEDLVVLSAKSADLFQWLSNA